MGDIFSWNVCKKRFFQNHHLRSISIEHEVIEVAPFSSRDHLFCLYYQYLFQTDLYSCLRGHNANTIHHELSEKIMYHCWINSIIFTRRMFQSLYLVAESWFISQLRNIVSLQWFYVDIKEIFLLRMQTESTNLNIRKLSIEKGRNRLYFIK